jgi:hypothetical protein
MSNLNGPLWERARASLDDPLKGERMLELRAGTLVEICPYGEKHAHHYLAHLDGERGVIKCLKGHGQDLKVIVKLAYNKANVPFPVQVIKPCKD